MLDRYIVNSYRQQRFSRTEGWILLFLTTAGAVARVLYHYSRPFTDDEVGTLLNMQRDIAYLLTHFQGWLTENYIILAEKLIVQWAGDSRISHLVIPLVAGIATIPLTALLARMVAARRTALISAALVAASPYLISYSGILRAYSLVTALSLVVVILFFRWYSHRTLGNGTLVALAWYLLVLFHPLGVYVMAFVLIVTGLDLLFSRRSGRDSKLASLWVPLSVSGLLVAASYAGLYRAMLAYGGSWRDAPPTSIDYIPYAFSTYFGNGYLGWLSAALFVTGLLMAFKHDEPLLILGLYVVIPILLMSIQGLSYFPWAYARFLTFLVPVCIMFIAHGVQAGASLFPGKATPLALVFTSLVLITWFPGLKRGIDRQVDHPWRQVAQYINAAAQEQDIILYGGGVEWLDLQPYFSKAPYVQGWLENYTKEQHSQSGSRRIFLVRLGPRLDSAYTSRDFGDIQVILYPPDSYPKQLLMIRDDLLQNITPGVLSPDLASDYRNIWVINKRLGKDDAQNFEYYRLYLFCVQLSDRQMNIPRVLLKQELQSALSQDVFGNP